MPTPLVLGKVISPSTTCSWINIPNQPIRFEGQAGLQPWLGVSTSVLFTYPFPMILSYW